MPDYSNGKIYTIRYSKDDTLIYVGSTTNPLFKRWHTHKTRYNNDTEFQNLLYIKMRETNDIDNWYMELYENYPCKSKEELNRREGQVIRQIGTLNHCIAGRSAKEWFQDNKDKIRESRQEYMIKYRDENKDKLKDQVKTYQHEHKDIIKEKQFKNCDCECGGHYIYKHKHRHLQSKMHKKYENEII